MPRLCSEPGAAARGLALGSVNSSSIRAPLTCSSLPLAPTWRFALEPCRPGVRTRWADLSQTTEKLGSNEREKVARLLSPSQPV